ncbi:hypothetical protein Pmani_017095 [Petrolisthes manimaculis]|uniref:Integrase zinc-binding domain-containing protein n=1 Tax=Petrolisthes manimaculis TaxID=1843537 RepID=A0AAE1PQ74_9EUCA|nr:hypothetical protein Pmani_017095 [Petrolisthes manimaculis]
MEWRKQAIEEPNILQNDLQFWRERLSPKCINGNSGSLVQRRKNVVIICDSQSVLQALSSPRPVCSRVVRDILCQLAHAHDVSLVILFVWMPGYHIGLAGNGMADGLARAPCMLDEGDMAAEPSLRCQQNTIYSAEFAMTDRQYQLDIVLASHRGAGDSDEAVALGGHVGRDKVIDRIMQRYWWRNVTSDVVETIKTCLRCHPQANGLVERNNRTVQNFLLRTLSDRHENWDKCLHGVLFALRQAGLISDTSEIRPVFSSLGKNLLSPFQPIAIFKEPEVRTIKSRTTC